MKAFELILVNSSLPTGTAKEHLNNQKPSIQKVYEGSIELQFSPSVMSLDCNTTTQNLEIQLAVNDLDAALQIYDLILEEQS